MAKEHVHIRLSTQDIEFIQSYKPDASLTEALEQMLSTLRTPHSDIPTETSTGLLDPSLPKETLEARKELLEACKRQELHQYVPPPCPFCAKISETEIECGKELKKGKKPLRMSTISCLTCWDRKEYIRKKVEKQKDNEPKPEPKPEQKTVEKKPSQFVEDFRKLAANRKFVGLDHYKCWRGTDAHLGTTVFPYEKLTELSDKIPCLKDPTIACEYTECKQNLMSKLREEAPELIKVLTERTISTYEEQTKVEGEA